MSNRSWSRYCVQFNSLILAKRGAPKSGNIYPHQSDYCDYCSKVIKETPACQQKIARHLQSGSTSEDVFEEFKKGERRSGTEA